MSKYLPLISGAVLIGCATIDFDLRAILLTALLLFLPLLDAKWAIPEYKSYRFQYILWMGLIATILVLLIKRPEYTYIVLSNILFSALPEEWFFRGYFLQRIEIVCGNKWIANVITSILFAILHIPMQGVFALTIFFPSLILGWIYQQRKDIVLVVLSHTVFNVIYFMYLHNLIVNEPWQHF